MHNRVRNFVFILLFLALAVPSRAQKLPQNGILFLRIQVTDSSVALQNVTRRPGKLKVRRLLPKPNALAFRAVTSSGDSLWEGNMDFPIVQSIEYVDSAGQIQVYLEKLPAREVVIRIPYFENTHYVEFSKIENVFAQTATIQQIYNNGPVDRRINIVFLSEGYTQGELGQYITDANTLLSYILSISPYSAYPGYFNAFAISIASNESGSDHPVQNTFRDTYFNSTYGTGSLQRLIRIPATGFRKVNELLQELMPEYDIVILIVNDPEYGGAGGFPAITSVHTSAPEIVVHEIGHSFAYLTDEYESAFPGYNPLERLNSTAQTERDKIRWNVWISPSTPVPTPESGQFMNDVGLYEGAQYHSTGWYRPKINCKMRSLGVPFCEVCAEAHVTAIYTLLQPVDAFFPVQQNFTINKTDSVLLGVARLTPAMQSIRVQWFVDGDSITGANGTEFLVIGAAFGTGSFNVEAIAVDTTNLVRIDSLKKYLQASVVWTVTVQETPTGVSDEAGAMPKEFVLGQNYPNPFNPQTAIPYRLPGLRHVKLDIFNLLGQHIRTLVDRQQLAGRYVVQWDGCDDRGVRVSSGVYLYRLYAEDFTEERKLILSR